MRKPRKAVQVIAIATCATGLGVAGLTTALSHDSTGSANVSSVAAKAPAAKKLAEAQKPTEAQNLTATKKAARRGSSMMKNKATGKCLRAWGNDLRLATCNRRDDFQYLGQWGDKMYFPDTGCASANKRTWDVRVEDCSNPPTHGYGFNWMILFGSRSYNTVGNLDGCYLEGGNKNGGYVRCSPGFKGDNKKWQWGIW